MYGKSHQGIGPPGKQGTPWKRWSKIWGGGGVSTPGPCMCQVLKNETSTKDSRFQHVWHTFRRGSDGRCWGRM